MGRSYLSVWGWCAAGLVAACGSSSSESGGGPGPLSSLEIRTTLGSDTLLLPDLSFRLTLKDDAGDTVSTAGIVWAVDDETILSIDSEGLVTAVGLGTTRVTASLQDETVGQNFTVTVNAPGAFPSFLVAVDYSCTASAPLPDDCTPDLAPIAGGITGQVVTTQLSIFAENVSFTPQDDFQLAVYPGSAPCQQPEYCAWVAPDVTPYSEVSDRIRWCMDVGVGDSLTHQLLSGNIHATTPGHIQIVWRRYPALSTSPSWVVRKVFPIFVKVGGITLGCSHVP